MCFQRKPGLGRYNATRDEWLAAYRNARINASQGTAPDASRGGVSWKADLIVAERRHLDPLTVPGSSRLEAARIVDELLSEMTPEE